MKVGTLIQHISSDKTLPTFFGLVVKVKKVNNEKVATVMWNDGIVIDWRYEYFASTDEECLITVCKRW